jgi:hypothetical protein
MPAKINTSMLLLFATGLLHAQEPRKYAGTVRDAQTTQSIQGAYISAKLARQNAVSNNAGAFSIHGNAIDSLVIDALGYERIVLALDTNTGAIEVKMHPVSFLLPDLTVTAYQIDWASFLLKVYKASFRTATDPFESDLQKTIDVAINGVSTRKISLSAYSHYEGFSIKGLTSYLRGNTFWYAVNKADIGDTRDFIDRNETGKPQVFTELDAGKFQWLLTTDTTGSATKSGIVDYRMLGISVFGDDSVYIVQHTPHDAASNKTIRTLNQYATNGMYTFFSAEKTYYIRKSDLRLLRIDFLQHGGNLDEKGAGKNIGRIDSISGKVGLLYIDNALHPAYLYQNYSYRDMNGNQVERKDSSYYSNVQLKNLADAELKTKYQLQKIYRSYPIRDAAGTYESRLGAFWWVPVTKSAKE